MKQLFTLLIFAFCFACSPTISFAQLADGSEAPDWTLTDLDGNTHTLYDELDAGRQVYLVFSATWCGPCWNYHNSGHMETIYEDYGPGGSNEARVYFIEADNRTNESCLYGPSGCNFLPTQGNWVDGIPFPIINLTSSNGPSVASEYQIGYYPTVYTICPDKRIFETGQASSQVLETYMTSCDMAPVSIDPYDELCYEDETGGIDIEIIEGHGNVNFSWSNGSNNQNLSNVGQGVYTVTATDANGVFIEMEGAVSGPNSALFVQEEELELAQPCFGDAEGVIELSATGGTPGYEAVWSDGETGFVRENLPVGNYSVEITDANGCSDVASYDITEPPLLTLGLTRINENCDQSDGVIIATAGGGTQPLQYDIGFGPSNNNSFTDLPAGNYSLSVTDANGCQEVDAIELENEPAPIANAPAEMEIQCSGNELIIDASGSEVQSGTDIEWSTTDGNIVSGGNSLTPTVDQAGTYTLILSNSSVCNDMAEVLVDVGGDQPIADAGETGELDCAQTTVTIGSGNSSSGPNIEYEWLNEDGEVVGTTQFVDVDNVGLYTLIVSDSETGCASEANVEVIEVSSDLEIETAASGPISCAVVEVEISGMGSTSGQNISYQWLDADGNEISSDLTTNVNTSGEYTLIILDSETGCSTQETVVVDENIDTPTAEVEGETVIGCDQEPVSLSVNSSATQRTVVWYRIDNGDLIEIGSGDDISISDAGEYQVEVTNTENGCATDESFLVDLDENVPSIELATPSSLSCIFSEITLDATASSQGPEFTYEWFTSDGLIVSGANTLSPVVGSVGTYILKIVNTDNGCENTLSVEVESYSEAPTAEVAVETNQRTLNFGADYDGSDISYSWDFDDGNTSNDPNGAHTYTENGNYEVCLTVSNDCGENTYCESVDITVEALSASGSVSNINCAGNANGAIQLEVSGGIAPYTIEWSTGDEDVLELNGLDAGIYTVTIRDAEGNEEVLEFEILQPEPILLENVTISNSSGSTDDGSISFDITGGTQPYSFSWSNGETTQNLDDLAPGEYFLTVVDGNNCTEEFGPYTVGVSSSIANELDYQVFDLYPNPVAHQLFVSLDLNSAVKDVQLEIINAQGQSLWIKDFGQSQQLREKVEVSQLLPGTYFMKLQANEKQAVRTFIVK